MRGPEGGGARSIGTGPAMGIGRAPSISAAPRGIEGGYRPSPVMTIPRPSIETPRIGNLPNVKPEAPKIKVDTSPVKLNGGINKPYIKLGSLPRFETPAIPFQDKSIKFSSADFKTMARNQNLQPIIKPLVEIKPSVDKAVKQSFSDFMKKSQPMESPTNIGKTDVKISNDLLSKDWKIQVQTENLKYVSDKPASLVNKNIDNMAKNTMAPEKPKSVVSSNPEMNKVKEMFKYSVPLTEIKAPFIDKPIDSATKSALREDLTGNFDKAGIDTLAAEKTKVDSLIGKYVEFINPVKNKIPSFPSENTTDQNVQTKNENPNPKPVNEFSVNAAKKEVKQAAKVIELMKALGMNEEQAREKVMPILKESLENKGLDKALEQNADTEAKIKTGNQILTGTKQTVQIQEQGTVQTQTSQLTNLQENMQTQVKPAVSTKVNEADQTMSKTESELQLVPEEVKEMELEEDTEEELGVMRLQSPQQKEPKPVIDHEANFRRAEHITKLAIEEFEKTEKDEIDGTNITKKLYPQLSILQGGMADGHDGTLDDLALDLSRPIKKSEFPTLLRKTIDDNHAVTKAENGTPPAQRNIERTKNGNEEVVLYVIKKNNAATAPSRIKNSNFMSYK